MEQKPHQRLKAFRLSRKWSKTALAARLGCDESYVSHVEGGRRRLGVDFALELEDLSSDWEHGPIRVREWRRKARAA